MYCDYFSFSERPFHITPDCRFLFLSKNHKEAFAHLLYGINNQAGFIALTGEVGTGKTTVLRTVLDQLDENSYRTALILNPCLSAQKLLRSINREFGIPYAGLDSSSLLDELSSFLLAENSAGRIVVLVIDEAQNLNPQVLEQIRLISNLETETDKLIQIVLAGQPELLTLLARTELRQLAQRITVSYHLLPMDYRDSRAYVEHRLAIAGGRGRVDFSTPACLRIYRFSGGSPRLINIACDRVLLTGYGLNKRRISGRIAAVAIRELKDSRFLPISSWQRLAAVTLAATISGTLLIVAALASIQRTDGQSAPLATLVHQAAMPVRPSLEQVQTTAPEGSEQRR